MLILSRKLGESIVIDGRIHVTIVRVEGEVVKLGITAPSEVPVHRKEVYERDSAQQPAGVDEAKHAAAETESRQFAMRRDGVENFRIRRRADRVRANVSDIRQPLTTVGETTGSFPGRAHQGPPGKF
jgi:carbon storage regulator